MTDTGVIFIPTLTAGGAERVAAMLANQWCRTRRVHLVTYFDEPQFYALDPRVHLSCLGFAANRGRILRVLDALRAARAFRRVIRAADPDFVLSFMNKYNVFAIASLGGTGTPVIASERDSPTEALSWARRLSRDLAYPSARGLVFQTAAAEAFIRGRSRIARAAVIPNPVGRIIEPAERRGEKVVLSVGRLVAKKAVDQLIRAFDAMTVPGWRLVICGDGPLRGALEAQASACDAAGRIEFVGPVTDLAPHFRRAGMFAFSSLYEGFPNALAEAVVSGLPCVAYDCPTGPSELIRDRHNGRLVPVGDWRGLALAMDEIAANADLAARYSANSEPLAAWLDPAVIADRFLDFCDEAAEQGVR